MRAEAPPHEHTWEITVAETASEQPYEVTEDGVVYVGLKLAHPYAKEYAARVQAKDPDKNYKVGDTIFVTREWGNALIEGGFVQIDPLDKQARQEALLLNRRNQPLTAKEMEEKVAAAQPAADSEDSGEGEAPQADPGEPGPDAATPAKVEAGAAVTAASAAKAAPASKGRTA